jgi:hypothetical protein
MGQDFPPRPEIGNGAFENAPGVCVAAFGGLWFEFFFPNRTEGSLSLVR